MNEPCDPARRRHDAQHNVRSTRAHTTAAHSSSRTDDDTHKHTRPSGQRYRSHGEHDRASAFEGLVSVLGLASQPAIGNSASWSKQRFLSTPHSADPVTRDESSAGHSAQPSPAPRVGTAIHLPDRRERKSRRDMIFMYKKKIVLGWRD